METATDSAKRSRWRRRFGWLVVGVFAFLAFEAALIALALQGPWLALLLPGVVCGVKAVESYKSMRSSQREATQP